MTVPFGSQSIKAGTVNKERRFSNAFATSRSLSLPLDMAIMASVDLSTIPVIKGAQECILNGTFSSLQPQNISAPK